MISSDFNIENYTEDRNSWILSYRNKKILGVLHQPFGLDKSPLILFAHGFAGNKVGAHRIYERISTILAKKGIASLRFDYRGCGDSEGDLLEMVFEDHIADFLQVFESISKESWVDPSRVAFLGRSMGGMVATIAAAQLKKNSLKALCLVSPVYDATPWLHLWKGRKNTDLETPVAFHGELISPRFLQQFFTSSIAKTLQEDLDLPLLHIHSKVDEVVPFSQAECYSKHWLNNKQHYTFHSLENSNHSFSDIKERLDCIEMIVNWFCNQLL